MGVRTVYNGYKQHMMCGITGTPGTGKSALADELEKRGYRVVHANEAAKAYALERDDERDSLVIDDEQWAAEFEPVEGIVEGHIVHLLPCDRIVILRCRPDVLLSRLKERGYSNDKIMENAEAEAIDLILIETLDLHDEDKILEIDTTSSEISECADLIEGFIKGKIPSSYGSIDWSDFIGEI